ncbi:hypothetical protein RUND412_005996 [Rhizina undulata]
MPDPPGSQWNKPGLTNTPWWKSTQNTPSPSQPKPPSEQVTLSGSRWAPRPVQPAKPPSNAAPLDTPASRNNSVPDRKESVSDKSASFQLASVPLARGPSNSSDVAMVDHSTIPAPSAATPLPAAPAVPNNDLLKIETDSDTDSDTDADNPYYFSFALAQRRVDQQKKALLAAKSASEPVRASAPAVTAPEVGELLGRAVSDLVKLDIGNAKEPENVEITPPSYKEHSVAATDDDGDVVMVDIVDPGSLWEVEIAVGVERSGSRVEIPEKPISSFSRIHNPTCLLILDTSFILSHLQLVNNLVLANPTWRNVVVVPWATIQELDGLKNNTRFQIMPPTASEGGNGGKGMLGSKHAVGSSQRINVGTLARNAINWIYNKLGKLDAGVWGQKKEECLDVTANRGDAAILDCCRYFFEKQKMETILLSNDRNLCVQAIIYNVKTVSFIGHPHTAEGILTQILREPPTLVEARPPPETAVNLMESAILDIMDQPIIPIANPIRNGDMTVNKTVETSGPDPPQTSEQKVLRAPQTPAARKGPEAVSASHAGGVQGSEEPNSRTKPEPTPRDSLMESVHAPKDGNIRFSYRYPRAQPPVPRHQRPNAIPIVDPSASLHPSPIRHVVDYEPPHPPRPIYEVKLALSQLLDEVSFALLQYLPGLMHAQMKSSLGDQASLDYLQIHPWADIVAIDDIEKRVAKHWMTVFNEVYPSCMQARFVEADLSGKWRAWKAWTGPGMPGDGPRYAEVKEWIERWDLVWKRLVRDEFGMKMNFKVVGEWRVKARGIGLKP